MNASIRVSTWLGLAVATLAVCSHAQAALPPGISGAWYNPAQSGHGVSVEILDAERALAFWFVYDQQGNPLHLYLDGRIEGRRIEATAYAPRGMHFGSFRNADLQMPVWGEVALQFDSCERGLLQWNSDQPGYGSGSSEIRRLTRISGLDCQLDANGAARAALLTGIERGPDVGVLPSAYAAVDENRALWMLTPVSTLADAVPGRTFVGSAGSVTQARIAQDGRLEFRRYGNDWIFGQPNARLPMRTEGVFDTDGGTLDIAFDSGRNYRLSLSPSAQQAVAPLSANTLAGTWPVPMRGQFLDTPGELEVGADGSVCLRVALIELEASCRLEGHLQAVAANPAFIEFELSDRQFPAQPAFRGRGWLQRGEGIDRLVLVGDNGPIGFGLIGRR